LNIPFTVQFIQPNPHVRYNEGKVAVRRGPLIYALDSADNDFNLCDVQVISGTYLEETITISGIEIQRLHIPGKVGEEQKTLKFVPYWSWGNRGMGDVLVWCKSMV
jgi:uncharacterized protein